MDLLASKGDEFAEGFELGEKAKKLAFECSFEDDCFFDKAEKLLDKECQTPQKFGALNYKECHVSFGLFLSPLMLIIRKLWARSRGKQNQAGFFMKSLKIQR